MRTIGKLLKRFLIWLLQGIIGAVFIFGFLLMVLEWAAGCGEHYIDAEGNSHLHQCIFISKPNATPPVIK